MTKTRWPAVGALVIGAGAWGVLWYPLRGFAHHGLSGVWLAVTMFAGAAFFALLLSVVRGAFVQPSPAWLGLSVLGGLTNIGFVVAVLHDNILRVTLLFYLAPVWSVLLARLFLRERLTAAVLAGVSVSVLGAIVLLWRHASLTLNVFDAVALAAGVSFAGANVLLRARPSLSLEMKILSTFAGVVLMGLAVLGFGGAGVPTVSLELVLAAAFLGGLGIFSITFLVQYGVTALPVRQSAVILLVEVVTAAFSQHILLHSPLGAQAVLGAVIMGGGVALVGIYAA